MAIMHGGSMRLRGFQSMANRMTDWIFFIAVPILLGAVLALLYYSVFTVRKLEDNTSQLNTLTKDNQKLLKEVENLSIQNKQLGIQNQQLSQDNKDLTLCVAKLFARYTQTQQPVVIKSLSKCETQALRESLSAGSNQKQSTAQKSTNSQKSDSPDDNPPDDDPPEPTLRERISQRVDELVEFLSNTSLGL